MCALLLRLALILGSGAALANAVGAQQRPGGEAVVLVTTYADGRTTHHVVTSTSRGSWTPLFPKLPGVKGDDGRLPVRALNYRRVLTTTGEVQVDISVLRGDGHEEEERVASVTVEPKGQVTVDALRGFGIMPVSLALTTLVPSTLSQPAVLNRTAGLEVVEITPTDEPGGRYRISVKNVSSQGAVNFHVVAHHGDRRALMANRGNRDSTPIIEAGATHTFTLDAIREPLPHSTDVTIASLDVIEIHSVLWEDGRIEGEANEMALALAVYLARADQLTRGVGILRAHETATPARERLREQLAAMGTTPNAALLGRIKERLRHLDNVDEGRIVASLQPTLAFVRRGILSDLDEAPTDSSFARWLADIAAVYERQAKRLASR